ncbi:flagellar biosynthesis protein FlhF [Symbiobacterium terraclitae]|uniref:Flagellar biosynthesis protein FlhF n=1 Tax=Symbiobacterium terraclitae TaxID=557451 RepID=A0ABS4JPZ1_9FIRM|nr:flagellar biosynthesis protein FlhF [Symbiobacterium terraclitae]MBP2017010.1 flagellar biosynthesis protein FlhF [Symbiobacterium terraclitae]
MMQVKKYVAPTYAEALILAKNELGTDAVIVESRKVRIGGIFGLFGREMTELTVAAERRPEPYRPSRPTPSRPAAAAARQAPATPAGPGAPAPSAVPAVPVTADASGAGAPPAAAHGGVADLTGLRRELADLRQAVTRLVEVRPDPTALLELKGYGRKVYEQLLDAGVEEGLALAVSRKVGTHATKGRALLRAELSRVMGPGAPIHVEQGRRQVVALVGPTGVGKTTTLAKLAAHFALERGLKVGLITADTFRIAAVDQLRTYADILSIPLYTVERPAEVTQALAHTAGADVVLLDTGGRSHRDEERMAELQELLATARPDETHLVVSLNTNPRDAHRMLERYLPLGVNRLIFTKADETSAPGLMLNIRLRSDLPVSYITAGQAVPDDLTPADTVDYCKLFMGA